MIPTTTSRMGRINPYASQPIAASSPSSLFLEGITQAEGRDDLIPEG